MKEDEIALKLGAMLKCAELEEDFEYRFMFDITANTFLQKLIPKKLMDRKLNINKGEYFKSLLILDYFVSVVSNDYKVIDNIDIIYRELIKKDPNANLRLDLILGEIALYSKEYKILKNKKEIKKRFKISGKCSCNIKDLDPYYEAIGFMLLDNIKIKDIAVNVSNKIEYKAAVFFDAILGNIKGTDIMNDIKKGNYFEASIRALNEYSKNISIDDIEKYL